MKRWMIGGFVGAFIGVSIYLMLTKKTEAEPVATPAAPQKSILPDKTSAVPAVLPNVVEVADLDPLLDPPARPMTGAPFDADAVIMTVPASAPALPPLIPKAVD